jgi:hypothetical protein
MQGIVNAEINVGFCMPMDLRSPVHPTPTQSVSFVMRNRSLMVSWVRPEVPPVQVLSLITSRQMGAVMYFASRCELPPRTSYAPSSFRCLTPASATQCIRQWRHPNNRSDDAETTNISCPYCRVPSYFVTPSSQFFPKDHPRRDEIVAQYKASMARVPCR